MNSQKKILKLAGLKKMVTRLRKQGKTIAFTNGCFDILHFGHVRYLEAAQKPNRVLIVGINSDPSVRRIKGPHRPIIPECHRATLVAALGCVDFVTIFDEETPHNLIKVLEPDILIKGADWRGKEVVGRDIVKSTGGKVEFIKYWDQFSTTKIIETIIEKCACSKQIRPFRV